MMKPPVRVEKAEGAGREGERLRWLITDWNGAAMDPREDTKEPVKCGEIMAVIERFEELKRALRPFAKVADDPVIGTLPNPVNQSLISNADGSLVTLADCIEARAVLARAEGRAKPKEREATMCSARMSRTGRAAMRCYRNAGHEGPHRELDGETWL